MSIHAGDTVRWNFAPAESMQDGMLVSHVVVSPIMPNVSTNLMIHTDRRVYQIDLVSVADGPYTPGVAFSHPNRNLNRLFVGRGENWDRLRNRDRNESERNEPAARSVNINTGYGITTRSTMLDWRPVAVFDDGVRTFIRMPPQIPEAPALYIRLDGRDTLVNYRIHGRYYIVDRLFDTAILRLGARSVTIRRTEPIVRQNELRDTIERLGF
jgi:type IV secretion system protein VirB9